MEFEKLVAEFAEAAGLQLEADSEGTVWCDADGVPVMVQHRAKSDDVVISTFPFGEMPADEPMMRHALELSVAGIGTGGFFLGLRDGIFMLSGVLPLEGLDAETLGRRMLDLSAATRSVTQNVGSGVADECVERVEAEKSSEDCCNQTALRV